MRKLNKTLFLIFPISINSDNILIKSNSYWIVFSRLKSKLKVDLEVVISNL